MALVDTHIVCYATQAWGHVRPLIHLSARFVKLRPVTVTLLTTNAFFERAKTELSRSFDPDEQELAERVRIISIGDVMMIRSDGADQYLEKTWKSFIEGSELVCALTSTRFPPLPKPKVAVLDVFAVAPFNSIKALSGDSVKVYVWSPALTYALCHLFGPVSLGGPGNLRIKIEENVRLTGRPFDELSRELVFQPVGNVVRLPGIPPMYDYEHYPQDFLQPDELFTKVFPHIYQLLEDADGLLLFTPETYEPAAVAAVKGWLAETGRRAHTTGPLLPAASQAHAHAKERKLSDGSNAIQMFLDETLKTSGEKSLVYISFGSIFWPNKTPEKVWAFLDVLMELNIPFILSCASPFAVVPDEVQEKVKVYGKGILSPWTPQQLILDHPTTGWFVGHGGHNGVMEAISAGVPMIMWPFGADQPLNAVHITENLQIGYELLEVRTGLGLKLIFRTGYTPKGTIEALQAEAREVLKKAFGEDGAMKRQRLVAVQKSIQSEWEDGGASKREVSLFLDSL